MLLELRIVNFGPIGRATIPLANQGLVYVTGRNNDTTAAKSNAAGKTHIWKALSWCLFGETVDGERGDELVHRQADSMSVETDLERADLVWTIRRARTKKAPKLALLCEGEEVELGKAELVEKIAELVGLDWSGFKNSILFGQGDIDRYANPRTTDAARKDMLHKILKSDRLKAAAKWIRAEAAKVEKAIAELEANRAQVEARLEEIDLGRLRSDRDSFEERRDEKLERFAGRLARAREQFDELTAEAEAGRAEFDEKIAEAEELFSILDKTEGRVEEISDKIAKAEEEQQDMRSRITWTESEKAGLEEQLEQLTGDVCPTCSGSLSSEHAESKKAELIAEIDNRNTRLASFGRKLEKEKAIAAGWRTELKKAKQAETDVAELERELDQLKADRASFDSVEYEAGLEKERAREILEEYDAKAAEPNPNVAAVAEAEKKVRKYERRIGVAEKALGLRRDELLHLKWWERGFGWKGLPAYMLDAVMPVLTEHANRYLRTLTDGDVKVEFSSRRELKSGDMRDELDVRVWNEGFDGTRPSGGQQKKIEIATDLALMKVVDMKGEANLGVLILDEALDGLDVEGRERVVRLLEELVGEIPSIFVIDHWGGHEHAFDRTLEAIKTGGVSSVEVG